MKITTKRALSTVLIAIVVLVVVAAAAGAYYFATTTGNSNQSSSISTSSPNTTTAAHSTTQQPTTTANSVGTTSTTTPIQTQTYSSYTCTESNSYTQTSSPALTIQGDLGLIQSISSMTVSWNGTSTNSTFNFISTYKVLSVSSSGGVTAYVVNLTESISTNETVTAEAKVLSDGTVPWVYESLGGYGYNNTTYASTTFAGIMAPFTEEVALNSQISLYTSADFVKSGTATETFGPTSMSVDSYTASNLPLNINSCGTSETITAFSLHVGTVPGTNVTLVTLMHFKGTDNSRNPPTNEDFTIQLLSITKA